MKKLLTMIEHATDFGSFRSRIHLFPFLLKIIMYIIPAIILGHYTDVIVKKMKSVQKLQCTTIPQSTAAHPVN